MEKITNAIILAAGMGTRMRPFTEHTHKAFLKINDEPIIEHNIKLLKKNDINDITIIVGYLSEQFKYLQKKYNVNLICNNKYNSTNNIYSLYLAKNKLASTIILESDIYIKDDNVIRNSISHSGYTCIYTDTLKNEYCFFDLDNSNKITNIIKDKGDKLFMLTGVSFWTKEDSKKLKQLLNNTILSKKLNKFWDEIVLFDYKNKFELYGYPVNKNALVEFDTYNEYLKYIGGKDVSKSR